MMNQLPAQNLSFTIALTPADRDLARQFGSEQSNQEKGKQIYLNTLAVLAVKRFLEQTTPYRGDLEQSGIYNSVRRSLQDASDLSIANLGHLECRPILPEQTTVSISSQIKQELRIGYVFVQFKARLDRVELLGFVRALDPQSATEISLQQLEPIDNLIDYLYQLEMATEILTADNPSLIGLRETLRSDLVGTIAAQFERILKLSSQSEQKRLAGEILDRTILTDNLSAQKEVVAQKIAEKLASVWQLSPPVWQQASSQVTPERSMIKWLSAGIDELATSIGWMRLDWKAASIGSRATKPQNSQKNRYLLTRQLQIAGQTYDLQIIPLDLQQEESTWRFQLRNATPGGFIPGGFKLKLKSETGQDFPDNSDFAATATPELYLDVIVESGEGLILETEPSPDNYSPEILRF